MKKQFCAVILGTAIALHSLSINAKGLEDQFFTNENPTLTQQERQALAIAQKWQAGSNVNGIKPFTGRNGSIQYVFGVQRPSVVCAVLQVCDIALQPGEYLNSIQLGDTARWNVEPAVSGTGSKEVLHLMVKPMDVGLETSLVVATDRRVYHIALRSHRTEYMSQVGFTYPEDALAKWDKLKKRERQSIDDNTFPSTREYLGDLDFDYDVSGEASWKPIRVFNDGVKTIIQMSKAMKQTEAPTLLVIRKEGGFFSDAETVMVNYRVQGDRFIVDTIFNKAILISGVGNDQDKITITKKGK